MKFYSTERDILNLSGLYLEPALQSILERNGERNGLGEDGSAVFKTILALSDHDRARLAA